MKNNQPIINFKSVSKSYYLYNSRFDLLKNIILSFFKKFNNKLNQHDALKNINFSLSKGESLGIVGENGSGKSTILHLIAGTSSPTSGSIKVNGRVNAMLELGSSFNPSLTGRDNIYLNARILGFSKEEIIKKLESIIHFADIDKFIDQPVRTYSSGMFMRLAFSVQIHVDPDILVIDEILATGDTNFQVKCFDRIKELKKKGVAIIIVSHDLNSISNLCEKTIYLESGKVKHFGITNQVIASYRQDSLIKRNQISRPKTKKILTDNSNKNDFVRLLKNKYENFDKFHNEFHRNAKLNRFSNCDARIINVMVTNESRRTFNKFQFNDKVSIKLFFESSIETKEFVASIKIHNMYGNPVLHNDSRFSKKVFSSFKPKSIYLVEWDINLALMQGSYYLSSIISLPPSKKNKDWIFCDSISKIFEFNMTDNNGIGIDGYFMPSSISKVSKLN